jgi:predicted phage gp36 major capsid-like protein
MSDLVERLRGDLMTPYQATRLMDEAADRIAQLEEANELMLTDIRRTDVDMLAFKARIEQLEAEIKTAIRQFEDGNRLECHRTLCTAVYGKQH